MQFTTDSRCIIYGTHTDIAQNMLDYDFLCDRGPSVAAFFSVGGGSKQQKLFYGGTELFLPTIDTWEQVDDYPGVDTLINLASFRSCTQVNKEALASGKFTNIFTIAEGVSERETRELIALAKLQNTTTLLGPAIVGGMISGVFRIGHTGGSLDNIIKSRLYQSGSVGIVSKSGGMMNELCRVVSKYTDGVHTALQVGGDRFPMTTFEDILMYFEQQTAIKMIVLLGEVGNKDELLIANMIRSGKISKPVVARCIGTAAEQLTTEVQFGHAGAKANTDEEKAAYKNTYLREAGARVPVSYDTFGELLGRVYIEQCCGSQDDITTSIPQHIEDKITIITSRRKTRFTSTISDDRKEELTYNGIPISTCVQEQSIAKVIGHLWFKKELPAYACTFITTALILLADHGPAVSGATNTIITARAGKDLVSSLIAGLATIGPRFGGAIDGTARRLARATKNNTSAIDIINEHKAQGTYIQGIGHKIKSKYNPDVRCTLLEALAKTFPIQKHFMLAKEVEALTLEKKPSLILNVDGHIAAMLLDLMVDIGLDEEERQRYIDAGLFNGFFVLSRSIGFIGHYLDQQRLQEGLYRTPWEDILYTP